ncbi:MAG: HD domain-containing protein [Lachnospiraceae bacterium]|nr:HD domain-containing protein [Lachnospiraceae bacterium]
MNNTSTVAKSRRYIGLISVYLGCILINILFSRLCGLLEIPLFLDCIGTLLAAICGGFLPGIIVGYVTNLINSVFNPPTAYYAVISVLIALSASALAYKGFYKKFYKSLVSIPVFTFLGGFLGSLLTYLLYGFGMGEGISAPFAQKLLANGTLSVFSAQLISDVAIDIIDKTVTVLIVYALLKLIPEKIRDSIALTSWQQRPLDRDEIRASHNMDVARRKLSSRIIMIVGSVMCFVAVTTCIISYVIYDQFAQDHFAVMGSVADVSAEAAPVDGVMFITRLASLFIGFFIVVLVFCLWHMKYHMTYPINSMTFAARQFAYNSEEELETGLRSLADLKISTGDEIEKLYEAVLKTMGDTVGYLEDVRVKGEQISRMQNGLIYILADLVESRDKCTGDHVKKTAAYVRLILELLRDSGEYGGVVTDEYIEDVCNCAPLHDIGKIKVSDLILNKPARLNDEEFLEMQKHTTAGKKIIESAMELTGGSSGYLKEALNLATYHHEKWDGSGYPEGLKGEEIPLSARIMAVSDVYDALLSDRSYKKAFSHEEAMRILKEGSGKHFDPVIVRLFSENEDKVRKIEEENRKLINSEKTENDYMRAV